VGRAHRRGGVAPSPTRWRAMAVEPGHEARRGVEGRKVSRGAEGRGEGKRERR
jgi:hypothetical protein